MTLVDEEIVREDVERDTGHVHLVQARGLVPAVPDETFVAPAPQLSAHKQQTCGQKEKGRGDLPRHARPRALPTEDDVRLVRVMVRFAGDLIYFAWIGVE